MGSVVGRDEPAGAVVDDLVRDALAGDRQALRDLFAHVICPILERKVARKLAQAGANRTTLRDQVQDVIVHLLDRNADALRRWDPRRGALEPYIARVAENHVISSLRRRPPPIPSDAGERAEAAGASPEQQTAFAHTVRRLLRELNSTDTALFRAIYLEDLSPQDAAAQLAISLEAAHKRIQRLRARLSEMLCSASDRTM